MADTRTWVTAIVALIVGAAIGYYVAQGRVSELEARLSMTETELVQANDLAGSIAADAEELSAENEALREEIEALRAELEAANQPQPGPTVEETDQTEEAEEPAEGEAEEGE